MTDSGVTHLLLDFFGTLVDYSPSRTEQGYHRSHAVVETLGAVLTYDEFLQQWSAVSAAFDERCAADDQEFSMDDVGSTFLTHVLRRPAHPEETTWLVETYLAEWNTGVVYPDGIQELIRALARSFSLAVVSNTHHRDLVPRHLRAMGVADMIDEVITSVEVGWRKPHPAIYTEALRRLGIPASRALFVGDTYLADYVGPRAIGIEAFLIDPGRRCELPDAGRLDSLTDLLQARHEITAARLAAWSPHSAVSPARSRCGRSRPS